MCLFGLCALQAAAGVKAGGDVKATDTWRLSTIEGNVLTPSVPVAFCMFSEAAA